MATGQPHSQPTPQANSTAEQRTGGELDRRQEIQKRPQTPPPASAGTGNPPPQTPESKRGDPRPPKFDFGPAVRPYGNGWTCECGELANCWTVKKDSKNKGKKFWSCYLSSKDYRHCDFFLFTENGPAAKAYWEEKHPAQGDPFSKSKRRRSSPAAGPSRNGSGSATTSAITSATTSANTSFDGDLSPFKAPRMETAQSPRKARDLTQRRRTAAPSPSGNDADSRSAPTSATMSFDGGQFPSSSWAPFTETTQSRRNVGNFTERLRAAAEESNAERSAPQNALPTPDTRGKGKEPMREIGDGSPRRSGMECPEPDSPTPIYRMHRTRAVDVSDTDLAVSTQWSEEMADALVALLEDDGVRLQESTEQQLRFEIGLQMDELEARVRRHERALRKAWRKLKEIERRDQVQGMVQQLSSQDLELEGIN